MVKDNKIIKKRDIIYLFLTIYFYCSLYMNVCQPAMVRYSLVLIVNVIYVLLNFKKIKLRKKPMVLAIVLCMIIMFSSVINKVDYSLLLGAIFSVLLGCLISLMFSLNYIIYLFRYIMIVVCLISTLAFYLNQLAPNLFSVFPQFIGENGIGYYELFICSIRKVSEYGFLRNFGIFREPGMFQIYLMCAMAFELFYMKESKVVVIMIYMAAVISSNSTTGYYIAFALFIIFIITSRTDNHSLKQKKLINWTRIILPILFFIIIFNLEKLDYRTYYTIVSKFTGDGANTSESATERFDAVYIAFDNFIKNPVFGVGLGKVVRNQATSTVTPLNWFMYFGVFYGCICNFLYILFWCTSTKRVIKYILAAVMVLAITSQDINADFIVYLFMMYAVDHLKTSNKYYALQ